MRQPVIDVIIDATGHRVLLEVGLIEEIYTVWSGQLVRLLLLIYVRVIPGLGFQ